MTMTVRGPNGLVVNFPDGTDPATIDRVMREAAAKNPNKPPLPWYGEEPGIAAKVLQGVGDMVTGIDDVMTGRVDPKSDQGIANIAGAATMLTPMSAASRGGLGWAGAAVKRRPVKPAVPTSDELLSTGGFGFDMARGMDVRFSPQSVQNMVLKLRSQLHAAGFRQSNAPKVFAELDALARPAEPGAFASIDDLHAVRMALREAAKPVADGSNGTEVNAASQFIRAIDEFITNPDPQAVVAGPAAAAGGVWRDAMGNYAAGKRSDRLMGIEESTLRRAKASNSGLNIDNTIRQRVASVLDNPAKRAGFSQEEIALLEQVANGTAPRNVLRWAGNVLGGGGGLAGGIAGGAGYAVAGPVGATAAVAIPLAAKLGGNKLTKNALRNVDTATRQRSPLYQERAANPQTAPTSPALRMAPVRAAAPPPQMTPQEWEEYVRQKYALNQGA